MKRIFIIAFVSFAFNAFGQFPAIKSNTFVSPLKTTLNNDTALSDLKVVHAKKETKENQMYALFLNDKLVSQSLLGSLNPSVIDSFYVVRDSIQIDNIQYYGQIYVRTKRDYASKLIYLSPKMISLTDLKGKYTNLENEATLFMLDGKILNADYDKYFVDENYLLTIIVDKVENTKENINLNVIKLLTKSADNIKKSKEIMIRGTEMTMNQSASSGIVYH